MERPRSTVAEERGDRHLLSTSLCALQCAHRDSALGAAALLSATLRALVLYAFLQSTRHMLAHVFPSLHLKVRSLVSSLGRIEGTNYCLHPAKWHHTKLRNIFFKWPPLLSFRTVLPRLEICRDIIKHSEDQELTKLLATESAAFMYL